MRPTAPATTGFSLSPGGLLLPYHAGVLQALEYHGALTAATALAGSSAGSIAVAAQGCGIPGEQVLEATIALSDEVGALGGARGRLMAPLRNKLSAMVQEEQFLHLQARPGPVAIAYREVFPFNQAFHTTEFDSRDDLMNAICHSSTFPFFTTNFPVALCTAKKYPRLVVDGFFTVPRNRFGCPDFDMVKGAENVDRTVMISCFPATQIKMDACRPEDCISPVLDNEDDPMGKMSELLRLATQSSSREELTALYENGWKDAERWYNEHGSSSNQSVAEEDAVADATTSNDILTGAGVN